MGYLPSAISDSTIEVKEETKYKDFYFDETTNSFTGNVVEGIKALKGWIYFALKIKRYKYPIYSFAYGNELEDIIGNDYDDELLQSECERYINDALLVNPYIIEISNVEVEREEEKIHISCIVSTKYGDLEINI